MPLPINKDKNPYCYIGSNAMLLHFSKLCDTKQILFNACSVWIGLGVIDYSCREIY